MRMLATVLTLLVSGIIILSSQANAQGNCPIGWQDMGCAVVVVGSCSYDVCHCFYDNPVTGEIEIRIYSIRTLTTSGCTLRPTDIGQIEGQLVMSYSQPCGGTNWSKNFVIRTPFCWYTDPGIYQEELGCGGYCDAHYTVQCISGQKTVNLVGRASSGSCDPAGPNGEPCSSMLSPCYVGP